MSVSSSNGSRDAENENQGRLVYDFVRCEEAALAEDERLRGYREHKQQQTLYQQVAAAYVSSLESHESAKHIKTCHFLPEIGKPLEDRSLNFLFSKDEVMANF